MINNVLTVLQSKLNGPNGLYNPIFPNDVEIAVIDNIAKHDDETLHLNDKVIITLLNVEEESTLKNRSRYQQVVDSQPIRYDKESPPAYLNLYVMIAANRSMYNKGLLNISKVIEIFQTNNILEYIDSADVKKNFKFRIELHSIPFEQLSYIWGLLGGKVMPSALYKISVIKIAAATEPLNIKLINEINIESIKVD